MPSDSRLVGRDAELALFAEWRDQAVSGHGRAVLVEGEPGIGKSALVRAVITAARERGVATYRAECDELGQVFPLRPLLDALAAEEKTESRLATVRRLLRGETAGVADPATAAAEQMTALLTEMCSAAPAVVVVDDLQWADVATLRVWEWLARSAGRTALLLVGVTRPVPMRPELAAMRRVVWPADTVRLGGLSDEAVRELVTAISGGAPGAGLLRLTGEAAGNPLYLTELLGSLIRSGRLTSDTGVVDVGAGAVPDSLVAAIADHLGFLSDDTRTVLRAAALLGVEFPVVDLAVVLGRRVRELVAAIDEARTAGVLRDAGDRLAFRHPLIWQSMYDGIAAPLRQAWHREAARAMAEAGVPDQRVARQLRLTIDVPDPEPLDETMLTWVAGAAPTLVAQAPQVATGLLRQAAAQLAPSTERGAALASHLADALYRTGECAEAVRVATRAIAEVTDSDVLLDLHWTAAQCRAVLGRTDEALRVLERASETTNLTARQRARLLVLTARAHRNLGEVSVAGEVAAHALSAAEEADDTWAIGWSLHVLIVVLLMRGEVSSVLPLFDRALEVIGNDPAHIDLDLLLRINKAVALGDLDRYDEALGVARSVRQHADHVGSLVRLAQAQSALGELLFEVGRWDDAQAEVETLPDDVKDPGATCCDRGVAAVIAFHRGDHVTARRHLHLAAPSTAQIGNRVVSTLAMAQSLDREVADQPEEALAVLTARVGGAAEEMDEVEDLLPEVARLAAQTDDDAAASQVASRAAELAQRSAVPHRLGTDAYCRGLLIRDPGLLQEAADRFRDAGRPLYRAKALEAAAVEFAARGDRDAARNAFTRADELYGWLRAEWDLGHLRAQLRQFGIRRGARAKHRQEQVGWQSLTPTERKVAGLVAEGMSNRLIAERLVLSTRTIETHVSHILAKLRVRSRIEIAREVAARG